jgi:hypothetical protein
LSRSALPFAAVLAAVLAAAPPGAAAGLDLDPLRQRVEEGLALGGPAPVVKAYRRLGKVLAPPASDLPDAIGRLRPVAGACAGPLVGDGTLRSRLGDALDGAEIAVRGMDAEVLGSAGELSLESNRTKVLRRAARARALERKGEGRRIFGADASAAALYRRAARGFVAAGRLADRLRDRETPKNPVFTIPLQGLAGALLGVWGEPGPDPRVYAVGAADADGAQFLVLHPGAEGWVRVPTGAGGALWWVTVVPGDGAWACGSGGRVVRYDPGTGELEDRSTGVDALLYGVWGSGPSDVWAVGGDPLGAGPVPAILHWDGDAWASVPPPAAAVGRMLYKVWGSAADDVWAVGDQGVLLHWDGLAWTSVPSGTSSTLLTVNGPSPVTAVGGGAAAVAVERGGDGTFGPVPVTGVNTGTGGQTGGGAVRTLNGVFVPEAGAALAVGFSGTVVRRAPSGWIGVANVPLAVKDLHAVWIDDDGNAWMAGGKFSTLTEGQLVAWGKRVVPSLVAPRVRFRDGVAERLYLSCAHSGCHLPPLSNAGFLLDTPETSHANLASVPSTQSPLLRVAPGRISQSYLWHKMAGTHASVGGSGDRMPILHQPGDFLMTEVELALFRGWILDGARDN